MDLSLLVTIAVIFVMTVVISALRGMRKDPCLRDFDGFHVTIERKGGHVIWGRMHLATTGFELRYRQEVVDKQGHREASYVLYKDEYPDLVAIYRYVDDLDPVNQEKRDRSCQKAFHPNTFHYLLRKVRNFINTAADSLTEVFNLLLGRSKPVSSKMVMPQGQTYIRSFTKDVLGYVGTSYDPLLESFIGVQVVAELAYNGQIYEYVGVLREYSAGFLELLDTYFPQEVRLILEPSSGDGLSSEQAQPESLARLGLVAQLRERWVLLRNEGRRPFLVLKLQAGDHEEVIEQLVEPHEEFRYALLEPAERVELKLRLVRQLDMILPRAQAVIRHRAERYRPMAELKLAPRQYGSREAYREISEFAELLLQDRESHDAFQHLASVLTVRDRNEKGIDQG